MTSDAPPARTPFWRSMIRYEAAKVVPWLALRNALGVGIPMIIGVSVGHPSSGLIGATGALNVAFSDGTDPYRHRLRRMLASSLCCSLAVLGGGLCGPNHPLAVTVAAMCAFAAGMMVAMGTTVTDIANVTLVTLIVYSAQSMTPAQSFSSGLAALGGGLLQTALALVFWPFRRYAPERRALADLYDELAHVTTSEPRVQEAPLASTQTVQAQTALAALTGDRSIEAERYLALLSQAERIRLALLALGRLRIRIGREQNSAVETGLLDRCLEIPRAILAGIAAQLRTGIKPAAASAKLEELRKWTEELRQRKAGGVCAGMLEDARWQLDALAGQLRSALELADHATPEGGEVFERRERAQPWSLRLGSAWAVLRANLNLDSAVFRHAIRLAASVAFGELVALMFGFRRPYWVPMTIAIVLRPDFTTTFSRGVLRVVGTLIGLGLATALFHLLNPTGAFEVLLIAVFAFLLRCFGPANYGIFAINLTAMVVLMFAVTGIEPGPVILARGINTLCGGAIALLAYQLWPTWERTQVTVALAHMLDAYRAYFQVVRDAYLQPDRDFRAALDATRQAARLARSNAEASVERLAAEPGMSQERVTARHRLLANSHRFIHAVMSLEAGLVRHRPAPPRDAFRTFSNHVDATLYYLAAALRGSTITVSELPDLREDHHVLEQSGDAHEDRYAMVNTEADRITNSLNTLALEILAA